MGLLRTLGAKPDAAERIAPAAVSAANSPKPKFDRARDASDAFIQHVENGRCPWQQPDPVVSLPAINGVTGRPYQGYNVLHLAMRGYDDPRWATFDQAAAQGWRIRKGERGTHVLAWKFNVVETGKQRDDGEPELRSFPVLIGHRVFNFAQMDGPGPYVAPEAASMREVVMPIAETMGVTLCDAAKGKVGYDRETDAIHVPAAAGGEETGRLGAILNGLLEVAAGEALVKLQLPAEGELTPVQKTQRDLRVEMARAMLSMRTGLPMPTPMPLRDSAVVELLQADKREITRACRDADAIMRYVLSFNPEQVPQLEAEHQQMLQDAFGAGAPPIEFDASVFDFWLEDRQSNSPSP